jgi:hypothetical protein
LFFVKHFFGADRKVWFNDLIELAFSCRAESARQECREPGAEKQA